MQRQLKNILRQLKLLCWSPSQFFKQSEQPDTAMVWFREVLSLADQQKFYSGDTGSAEITRLNKTQRQRGCSERPKKNHFCLLECSMFQSISRMKLNHTTCVFDACHPSAINPVAVFSEPKCLVQHGLLLPLTRLVFCQKSRSLMALLILYCRVKIKNPSPPTAALCFQPFISLLAPCSLQLA